MFKNAKMVIKNQMKYVAKITTTVMKSQMKYFAAWPSLPRGLQCANAEN